MRNVSNAKFDSSRVTSNAQQQMFVRDHMKHSVPDVASHCWVCFVHLLTVVHYKGQEIKTIMKKSGLYLIDV